MCLYPKLIQNRKYLPNKKNGGIAPQWKDDRTLFVPVGCGKCIECMKQKSREWAVRLQEDIRQYNNGKFVTLSFSDDSLNKLEEELTQEYKLTGYTLDNAVAKLAVRRFLERWRKKHKKSIRHWLITELGQTNTERLHIHGILFTDELEDINKIWKYGNVWIGSYVNEKTINYIVKYLYKTDTKHKYYTPIILCSKGIGSGYFNRSDYKINKYNNEKTNEMYTTKSGVKLPLPKYYRNKIYSDDEKESLWINLLNKEKRYVLGLEIDAKNN